MSKLKLQDLIDQGLELSKSDAQELHSIISRIAQHGHDVNDVYPGTSKKKEAGKEPASDQPPLQKKLTAADFRGDKGKGLKEDGFKVGDLYPPNLSNDDTPSSDDKVETEDRAVTEADIEADPTLATEKGLKVGDIATFPKPKSE